MSISGFSSTISLQTKRDFLKQSEIVIFVLLIFTKLLFSEGRVTNANFYDFLFSVNIHRSKQELKHSTAQTHYSSRHNLFFKFYFLMVSNVKSFFSVCWKTIILANSRIKIYLRYEASFIRDVEVFSKNRTFCSNYRDSIYRGSTV